MVFEIKWKRYGTPGQATDDNMIRRMRIAAGWGNRHIPRICNANYISTAEYRERASVLRYMYIACPVEITGLHVSKNQVRHSLYLIVTCIRYVWSDRNMENVQ